MGRILPVELKEFDSASLSGSPQDFGTPLLNPAIKVNICNGSTVDCYVTSDGPVPQTFRIIAGLALTLDESTLFYKGGDQEFYMPKGAQLSIEQVTASGTGPIVAHIVTRAMA